MKETIRGAALFSLLTAAPLLAHPSVSVSVVRDARDNVFYSDLACVWKISPEGRSGRVTVF